MKNASKTTENKCSTEDGNKVKSYCQQCKVYICTDCLVAKHIDHDGEVIDLAEKATRYLADYQKLARAAVLISDRRQILIKNESISSIVDDLKKKVLKVKDSLQTDLDKSFDNTIKYIPTGPLMKDFVRKKRELGGREDDPLMKLKEELGKRCADLLNLILKEQYETADKQLYPELLQKFEEEIQKMTQITSGDKEFIQELCKLKKTDIKYTYNPMMVLGMIKLDSKVKKPKRIIQFNREQNLVMICNLETNKAMATKITSGFILPFRFVSIEADNDLYLIGGDNDHNYYLKSLHLYDELRGVLIPLSNMSVARSRHTATSIPGAIFVMGGENAEGVISSCERYDIKEDTWKSMPSLNKKRCGLSSCMMNNWIYVGFGWDQSNLNSIERLDTEKNEEWEMVKLGKKQMVEGLQVAGMVGMKENEILVFGGYKQHEKLTTETLILNIKDNTVKKGNNLVKEEAFISSEIRKVEDLIYACGYLKGGIHAYDITKDQWNFTAQDKIPRLTLNH